MKEKTAESAEAASEATDEDFRQREFVRPVSGSLNVEVGDSARRTYHPLAEKALEKIDRVKASSADTSAVGIPTELNSAISASIEPEARSRRRRSARKNEKTERIEIDLNQPTLPFESAESRASGTAEDQIQKGLTAAALGPRARAALIDALFVFGCFLIFVLIVFFVPEFALFTKSSFVGMGLVLLLIFLSYISIFTTLGGRTLGMDHEQLEAVSYQGNPMTSREASLRSFGYLVSLGCFGLGFFWALFDPEQLTWHDKISRTLVVQKLGKSEPSP